MVFLPPLMALYRGILTPIPKFNRGVFTYIPIPIGVFLPPCGSISPLTFLQWSASQWPTAPRDIKWCLNRIKCPLSRHFYHLLWGCSHLLACRMWWSLNRDVHNEPAPVLDALNLSLVVWIKQRTWSTLPYRKKFSSQKQLKTLHFWTCESLSGRRCAIGVSVYNCVEMTRCSASGGA